MEKIDESFLNGIKIIYYKGFNLDNILNHSKDGSDGMMVVFFNSDDENKKFKRDKIISNILEEEKKIINFIDVIRQIDNPYISLYETHGYDEVLFQIIKNKLECIKDSDFISSELIWKTNI